MNLKKSMVALGAITYGLGSVVASAAPVAPVAQPVTAESQFGSEDGGDTTGTLLLIGAVVAIIAAIVLIGGDDDEDEPLSP